MARLVIGVFPSREFEARPRLFSALQEATDALFAPWSEELGGQIDALLCLSSSPPPPGIRVLVIGPGDGPPTASSQVSLGGDLGLDRRLRGRALRDDDAQGVRALRAERGDSVLGHTEEGAPLWIRAGLVDRAAVVPRELAPDEGLRDAFRNGRFLGLLPLVHLVRELDGERRWRPPSLRASFVFDDPNLRRAS